MKLLSFLVLFLSLNAFAETPDVSITVGHQSKETIEIFKKEKFPEVRILKNGTLMTGRVITDKTHERIVDDIEKTFPDKKSKEVCTNPITIEYKSENGAKTKSYCEDNLSASTKKKFSKLFEKLKDLAYMKTPIY